MTEFSPSTLDQAIAAYKADPTEYNRQRVLAAQKQKNRDFMMDRAREYQRRTRR